MVLTCKQAPSCCKKSGPGSKPLRPRGAKATALLLSLGMQSGNGDAVMVEIADRLSEEADIALTSRVEKLEPTLVLITSVLVGIILLSVMLPLMNIMETIG